jgi:hypothetical protein
MVEQYFFCALVSIVGVVGRFVVMVMIVEEEMLQVLGLLQISVSYSQFCYTVLCMSYINVMMNTCRSKVKWKITRKLY